MHAPAVTESLPESSINAKHLPLVGPLSAFQVVSGDVVSTDCKTKRDPKKQRP